MGIYPAILDFRRARRQAYRERLMARLTGSSAELLSYEQVRQMLRAQVGRDAGLREIPLDAIVGSVGRYSDFTRSFLPLEEIDEQRWARVQTKMTDLEGLPPIEVYQIDQAYFVRDGHHRVSVARQFGATHIEAYVTELEARASLSADTHAEDLILMAEYTAFLERTCLDELRPAADLHLTIPGRYPQLLEHIDVHRYFMGLAQEREIPYPEAVSHWYDEVYMPVVSLIRQQHALQDFPERTEADLYLWVSEHQAALEEMLGWEIRPEAAAADLAEGHSPRPGRRFARLASRLLDALTPDVFDGGPRVGRWRMERLAARRDESLFAHILVPVSGEDAGAGWPAVAQAAELARRETAQLLGLYVAPSVAEMEGERARAAEAEFDRLCEQAGVSGSLVVEAGPVARTICERSRWADLVVVGLAHPPAPRRLARLGSGFRLLIRRCQAPILAVPGSYSPLRRPLLAYDGSPKAREALFIATYLAARDELPLVVVCVLEDSHVTEETLAEAREYLVLRGVQATYVQKSGPITAAILNAVEEHGSDLLLMGGYGHGVMAEVVLGSSVDEVLRSSLVPTLIAR